MVLTRSERQYQRCRAQPPHHTTAATIAVRRSRRVFLGSKHNHRSTTFCDDMSTSCHQCFRAQAWQRNIFLLRQIRPQVHVLNVWSA